MLRGCGCPGSHGVGREAECQDGKVVPSAMFGPGAPFRNFPRDGPVAPVRSRYEAHLRRQCRIELSRKASSNTVAYENT